MSEGKSKFNFEGALSNNQGQVNIGEQVNANYSPTTVQQKIVMQVNYLLQQLGQINDLPVNEQSELQRLAMDIKDEANSEKTNTSRLRSLGEKLKEKQHLLTSWQTLTSTISTICDLIQLSKL